MIHTSLSTLLIIGLAMGVLFLGLLWLMAVVSQRRHEKRAQQHLVQCRICGFIYEDPEKKNMSACPSCGSLNEVTRTRAI